MTRRLLFALFIMTFWGTCTAAEQTARKNNLLFNGTLVSEACTLLPEDETIDMDLGTIMDRYFYKNSRTSPKPFSIHLTNCDLTISKSVNITFSGNESSSLPGLLALDSSSEASGLAIGIETEAGKIIPLNQKQGYPLEGESTVLHFQAFIQGLPEAVNSQTIGKGAFSAAATFELSYD